MIIVFGSISMDMHLRVADINDNQPYMPAAYDDMTPGGKAASQALAAARSGAKVTLVGKVGDDEFSNTILNRLRREGVLTTGVAKSDLPTGINVFLEDGHGNRKCIMASGANSESKSDQVPEEILNEKAILLLQTEIKSDVNSALLSKAKGCGATTILNLAPSIELSRKTLNSVDYLVVNEPEAEKLAAQIGLNVQNDALKLAEGLAKQGGLTCIVTIGARGCVAYTDKGIGWTVGALRIGEIVDRAGAEDAYCGTLAACLQAGMPLPRAMKRASIAGSLACMKKGGLTSLPHVADIDERINDLEDPLQVKS